MKILENYWVSLVFKTIITLGAGNMILHTWFLYQLRVVDVFYLVVVVACLLQLLLGMWFKESVK